MLKKKNPSNEKSMVPQSLKKLERLKGVARSTEALYAPLAGCRETSKVPSSTTHYGGWPYEASCLRRMKPEQCAAQWCYKHLFDAIYHLMMPLEAF